MSNPADSSADLPSLGDLPRYINISVQLDADVVDALGRIYPDHDFAEIARHALTVLDRSYDA